MPVSGDLLVLKNILDFLATFRNIKFLNPFLLFYTLITALKVGLGTLKILFRNKWEFLGTIFKAILSIRLRAQKFRPPVHQLHPLRPELAPVIDGFYLVLLFMGYGKLNNFPSE